MNLFLSAEHYWMQFILNIGITHVFLFINNCRVPTCADPEGGQGIRTPPLKNHKFIGFPRNPGLDPRKITKLPSQHSMWAIIGPPANAISMAFCWQADKCPLLVVFGASLPLKKKLKPYQSWTPTDRTFWIRACLRKLFEDKADRLSV